MKSECNKSGCFGNPLESVPEGSRGSAIKERRKKCFSKYFRLRIGSRICPSLIFFVILIGTIQAFPGTLCWAQTVPDTLCWAERVPGTLCWAHPPLAYFRLRAVRRISLCCNIHMDNILTYNILILYIIPFDYIREISVKNSVHLIKVKRRSK